ncbi:MAG: single-stranded-DNA-specific exonuclease RecJ [Bacteroidales bacterium]|jgi:single-stranded-DNA-specific exonuclease|nr:single-stranded-DNA-specific exonuclease RecJ [Bacteroidales bacterium]
MEKRWIIEKNADKEIVKRLSEVLHINKHLANLLAQRGVSSYEEAKAFFRPSLHALHDPFLMKDMDLAVDRIGEAMQKKERILIYGDYDVDGTTAVALVYLFLKSLGADADYYIPDRYNEGYGISQQGINYAAENNFTLVIALDCGIKTVEKIQDAKKRGIDFIICDHHRPSDELPPAIATLDPKRADCNYPYKELSGCGVGFKLLQAFSIRNNIPFRKLIPYLDLAVVSIASDIVPITGENRILAFYGLQQINQNPSPGIKAILDIVEFKNGHKQPLLPDEPAPPRNLTISDLVFSVGPRINAAGRMESGRNSVTLLVCKDQEQASQHAIIINDYKDERRILDSQITQEAIQMIHDNPDTRSKKATLLYSPEWHKGVIGIVASRLIEEFYRPTIIFCKANGLITGSARSVKGFDIYDAIDACSDLLEHFGGHTYAAGLSLKPENMDAFLERFEKIVSETIEESMLTPEVMIDDTLQLTDITPRFFKILKQFAPFGPGNPIPMFKTDQVVDTGYSKIVGKNHLKLSIVHPHISSFPFSGIAFQQGDKFELIKNGRPFNICYHIEENVWNGKTSLQLHVKDIKPYDEKQGRDEKDV